mmetsp:Transcript_8281/g.5910  ORF Transcript_8281/g.5910 Transcript_8281/m.5910 type:complete len:209 (+) Transcript_8281:703-1329(+)
MNGTLFDCTVITLSSKDCPELFSLSSFLEFLCATRLLEEVSNGNIAAINLSGCSSCSVPDIAFFTVGSVNDITIMGVKILAFKAVLLNCTSSLSMRGLNTEHSTLLFDLLLIISEWDSMLIQDVETLHKELEECFVLSSLTERHTGDIASFLVVQVLGDKVGELCEVFTINLGTHPHNNVLMTITLNVDDVDTLGPEVSSLFRGYLLK